MDRLHQQPFLTVFCNRGRFPMECGVVDLLQRICFLIIKFFGRSCIKGYELPICIFNPCSVILNTIEHHCTVFWNHHFSFCQFRHLQKIISSAVSLFYQTSSIPARIRIGSCFGVPGLAVSCALFHRFCPVCAFCDILLKAHISKIYTTVLHILNIRNQAVVTGCI